LYFVGCIAYRDKKVVPKLSLCRFRAPLQVQNISKSYQKNNLAVKSISFEVKEGELFGLGPDGAGKQHYSEY
jgi:ABC-type glutathione transport system ATPase component